MPVQPPPETSLLLYQSREAIAVFADSDVLEAAVTALEIAGFERAAISVLGAGIDLLKPGLGEMEALVGRPLPDPAEVRALDAAGAARTSRRATGT